VRQLDDRECRTRTERETVVGVDHSERLEAIGKQESYRTRNADGDARSLGLGKGLVTKIREIRKKSRVKRPGKQRLLLEVTDRPAFLPRRRRDSGCA